MTTRSNVLAAAALALLCALGACDDDDSTVNPPPPDTTPPTVNAVRSALTHHGRHGRYTVSQRRASSRATVMKTRVRVARMSTCGHSSMSRASRQNTAW